MHVDTIYSFLLLQRTSMSKANFVHSLRVSIWVFIAINGKILMHTYVKLPEQEILGHVPRGSSLIRLLFFETSFLPWACLEFLMLL